jgi:hypothetical protein
MPIISKTIDAENQFTAWKLFTEGANVDLSIGGTISDSTITLQRKFTKYGTAVDVDTFTAAEETYFVVPTTAYYRLGVKTGDFGTDSPVVKMVL